MKKILGIMIVTSLLALTACGSTDVNDTENLRIDNEVEVTETSDAIVSEDDTAASADVEEAAEPEGEIIMAPDFTLTNINGVEMTLSDLRGKIVFLNFFTTWCTYCETEMPDFEEASAKYSDDVEFLIVDVFQQENVSKQEVINWYEDRGFTMPMVIDEEGILAESYPVPGFPTTYFIDRDGSLIAYYPGAMTPEIIDQVVEEFR